jgi:hypothetical protein
MSTAQQRFKDSNQDHTRFKGNNKKERNKRSAKIASFSINFQVKKANLKKLGNLR